MATISDKYFSGTYYYSLDPKGRLMVPSEFRDVISQNYSDTLMITNTLGFRCLTVYPFEEWAKLLAKVELLPQSDDDVMIYMRYVVGAAMKAPLDKQGRVLVPSALRQNAALNSEVALVGLSNRIEIWDKAHWDDYTSPDKVDFKKVREGLAKLGL